MATADATPDDPLAAAAEALYGVDLGSFVAERKRLADERKAAGDKAAAAAVAKLARPAMSAWVVNRLWRTDQAALAALLDAGNRVKAGDRAALEQQRAILARLRAQAAAVLVGGGHAASPATLQRIATTLQALSALGTWAPDRPGQLVADRDPPGFDVMLGAVLGPADAPPPTSAAAPDPVALAAAERARVRAGERAALAAAAATAQRDLALRTAEHDRAQIEVEAAETALARAQAKAATTLAAFTAATARATAAVADLADHDAVDR